MKQTFKTAGKLLGDSALLLALAVSPAAMAQDDILADEDWQLKKEQFQEQLRQNLDERQALLEAQRKARRQALANNPELRAELRNERRELLDQQRNPRRVTGVEHRVRHLRDINLRQMHLRQSLRPARLLPGHHPFRRS